MKKGEFGMNANRKVRIYKKVWSDKTKRYETVEDGYGIFHEFGVNYDELETGPGNFTVGVIELPNGKVELIYVDFFEFVIEE